MTSEPFTVESLAYDADGLIPAIAQQHDSGEVLMLAWMDAEAVQRTLASGDVTYFSRSRQQYWVKGETSGNRQRLVEMRYDCDQDCLLLLVDQTGPACHTGTRSCFTGRAAQAADGDAPGAAQGADEDAPGAALRADGDAPGAALRATESPGAAQGAFRSPAE